MLCLWWLYLELGLVAAPELAGSAAPGEYKCTARGLAYGRAHGGRYRASITRKATGAERVNTRTPTRTRGVHGHLASLRAPAGMTRAPPSRSTIDSPCEVRLAILHGAKRAMMMDCDTSGAAAPTDGLMDADGAAAYAPGTVQITEALRRLQLLSYQCGGAWSPHKYSEGSARSHAICVRPLPCRAGLRLLL